MFTCNILANAYVDLYMYTQREIHQLYTYSHTCMIGFLVYVTQNSLLLSQAILCYNREYQYGYVNKI